MNFHEGLSLAVVQGISAITVAPVGLLCNEILARFCCMFKAFHMYVPIVVARPSAAITRILNYHCRLQDMLLPPAFTIGVASVYFCLLGT